MPEHGSSADGGGAGPKNSSFARAACIVLIAIAVCERGRGVCNDEHGKKWRIYIISASFPSRLSLYSTAIKPLSDNYSAHIAVLSSPYFMLMVPASVAQGHNPGRKRMGKSPERDFVL